MNDVRRWTVPGRVTLLGEHVDYAGGPTLSIAIDRSLTVKARARTDGQIQLWSGGRRTAWALPAPGVSAPPAGVEPWARYVAAAVWAAGEHLAHAGAESPTGADLVIEGDLPAGAGLSSSAAVVSGVILALFDLARHDLPVAEVAALAHHAESRGVGVPVGRLDHLSVLCAQAGHALRIDHAAEPPTLTQVPVEWVRDGLALLVIDSRVQHALADSEYATRREECTAAAEALGLPYLAAAGVDAVLKLDDDVLIRRTRHVITEATRVRAAGRALTTGAWAQFGALLTATHVSLSEDFEVSCPEIDSIVSAAGEAGALGARIVGGGFGGSAIALVPRERVAAVTDLVRARQAAREWPEPIIAEVTPAAGAHRLLA